MSTAFHRAKAARKSRGITAVYTAQPVPNDPEFGLIDELRGTGAAVRVKYAAGDVYPADGVTEVYTDVPKVRAAYAEIDGVKVHPIGSGPDQGGSLGKKTKAELMEIAEERGLSVAASATKAEILAALEG